MHSKLIREMKILRVENLLFYIFLLLYLFYLVFLSYKLGLSYDEPFSLNTTDNKLTTVIRLSYYFEGQPPAYFIILSVWRKINDSILFARLLSIIFTLFSAMFLNKIISEIFDKTYSKWIIVLFLINPYTVWASLEIRLYAMLILLTLIYSYLFCLIYFHKKTKLNIVLVIVGIIGVYTQYYFVFLIIAFSVLLLYRKDWNSLVNYFILSTCIAFMFIPNLLFIRDQYSMHDDIYGNSSFIERSRPIVSSLGSFLLPAHEELGKILRWTLRLIFVVLFGFSLIKSNIQNKNHIVIRLNYILIISLFLSFVFIILYGATSLIFRRHYLTLAFPFYTILLFHFGISLRKPNRLYALYFAYLFFSTVYQYKSPYLKSFNYNLTNYIYEIQSSKEPILVQDRTFAIGFAYYYKGKNHIIPIPELRFDYNFYNDEVKDTTELNQLFEILVNDNKHFLFVTGYDKGFNNNQKIANDMIDTYLENKYYVLMDTTFNGYYEQDYLRLRRLEKK